MANATVNNLFLLSHFLKTVPPATLGTTEAGFYLQVPLEMVTDEESALSSQS